MSTLFSSLQMTTPIDNMNSLHNQYKKRIWFLSRKLYLEDLRSVFLNMKTTNIVN